MIVPNSASLAPYLINKLDILGFVLLIMVIDEFSVGQNPFLIAADGVIESGRFGNNQQRMTLHSS